jgi:hypothetical protein
MRLTNMGKKPIPAEQRFWSKVNKGDGCWEWMDFLNNKQYGTLRVGSLVDGTRRRVLAHRFSWEMHFGSIPSGMFVCHRCDNPKCVNPDHLFLGTAKDNIRDMFRKGRGRPGRLAGAAHGRAKLTEDDVRLILSQRGTKLEKELAAEFGVSQSQISNILTRQQWGHVQIA